MSYQEGFGDSLELCFVEVKKAKTRMDALDEMQYFWGLLRSTSLIG
jgi:hypothetical protein